MLRRIAVVAVVVVLTLVVSLPALAVDARGKHHHPPNPQLWGSNITSLSMAQSYSGSECGVQITATLENIGQGRYGIVFGYHSTVYDTTITISDPLAEGQTSASERLGVCSAGDTFDRGSVSLYQGGRLIGSGSVMTLVTCPETAGVDAA